MRSRRSLLIGISPTRHARAIPARLTRPENVARFLSASAARARHIVASMALRSPRRGADAPGALLARRGERGSDEQDRKSTRLNSSHGYISYAVFCLKKKNIH